MDIASKVIDLEDARVPATMGSISRAEVRGFPMFMLCLNEDVATPRGPQSAPVVTICNRMDRGMVEDWSQGRHTEDPFRRMSANGLLDRSGIRALLWENENGRISLPSAQLTSSETEMMHLAYAKGVRTGVNVPITVAGVPAKVIVSFFSGRSASELGELEDSLAILFYLAHSLYDGLARHLESEHRTGSPRLTPRERECLLWVARGKTATEMAVIMGLSVATVRDHIKSMRGKLGASTRAEAIARAAALGELPHS